ncbi:hypothetical protein KAI56_03595 [Candidatus Parcubacteria bacterium]|nr:hypothetical protein [Candidatus Parcubacteria bacterium]
MGFVEINKKGFSAFALVLFAFLFGFYFYANIPQHIPNIIRFIAASVPFGMAIIYFVVVATIQDQNKKI